MTAIRPVRLQYPIISRSGDFNYGVRLLLNVVANKSYSVSSRFSYLDIVHRSGHLALLDSPELPLISFIENPYVCHGTNWGGTMEINRQNIEHLVYKIGSSPLQFTLSTLLPYLFKRCGDCFVVPKGLREYDTTAQAVVKELLGDIPLQETVSS